MAGSKIRKITKVRITITPSPEELAQHPEIVPGGGLGIMTDAAALGVDSDYIIFSEQEGTREDNQEPD